MKRMKKTGGFTILEASIAVALLTITILPLTGAMKASVDSHAKLMTHDLAEERVRKVSARLAHYLRGAGVDTLNAVPEWPTTSQTIVFKRAVTTESEVPVEEPGGEGETQTRTKEQSTTESTTQKWTLWEAESSLSYSDGHLRLTNGSRNLEVGKGLTNVTFSRLGRKIIVNLRFDTQDSHGDTVTVSRRIHVTVQN